MVIRLIILLHNYKKSLSEKKNILHARRGLNFSVAPVDLHRVLPHNGVAVKDTISGDLKGDGEIGVS